MTAELWQAPFRSTITGEPNQVPRVAVEHDAEDELAVVLPEQALTHYTRLLTLHPAMAKELLRALGEALGEPVGAPLELLVAAAASLWDGDGAEPEGALGQEYLRAQLQLIARVVGWLEDADADKLRVLRHRLLNGGDRPSATLRLAFEYHPDMTPDQAADMLMEAARQVRTSGGTAAGGQLGTGLGQWWIEVEEP